jgi:outer membrane lipoprotein-sorting protein
MMISRRLALSATLGLFVAGPLHAAQRTDAAGAATLSSQDQALVDRATAYLDTLETATGAFVQTTADGRTSAGDVWLQRPGRARFDYAAPSGLKIAADGHVVTVVDERLRTIHSYPLGATPLSLFLARHVALDRGARVEAVEHGADGFSIRVRGGRGAGRGSISLAFRDDPLTLAGWTVTDARGATVRVRITRLERSAPRPADFFVLRAPAPDPAAATP